MTNESKKSDCGCGCHACLLDSHSACGQIPSPCTVDDTCAFCGLKCAPDYCCCIDCKLCQSKNPPKKSDCCGAKCFIGYTPTHDASLDSIITHLKCAKCQKKCQAVSEEVEERVCTCDDLMCSCPLGNQEELEQQARCGCHCHKFGIDHVCNRGICIHCDKPQKEGKKETSIYLWARTHLEAVKNSLKSRSRFPSMPQDEAKEGCEACIRHQPRCKGNYCCGSRDVHTIDQGNLWCFVCKANCTGPEMRIPHTCKLNPQKDLLENWEDKIPTILSGNYACARVWSAWNYGTMKRDDFSPLEEDENIIEEFNDLIKQLLAAQRKRDAEIVLGEKFQGIETIKGDDANYSSVIFNTHNDALDAVYEKILNQNNHE